jgi:mRNA-degrading endonuclease RelE of RelBE toxin-antitoxin system
LSYTVLVERRAEKELRRRIHAQAAERISEAITALAEDPYPKDSTKLTNAPGYRLKIGRDYRALYFVDEEEQVVSVTRVGTREGFYG